MSRVYKNIRKTCDDISTIGNYLTMDDLIVQPKVLGKLLKNYAHKIKRTTWRGNTKKSIKLKLYSMDWENRTVPHPPATDY